MIRLFQVKCASENEIEAQILKKLRIRKEDLLQWHIHRKSVDARHQKVLFSYVVDCKVKNEKKLSWLLQGYLTKDMLQKKAAIVTIPLSLHLFFSHLGKKVPEQGGALRL